MLAYSTSKAAVIGLTKVPVSFLGFVQALSQLCVTLGIVTSSSFY